MTDILAVTVPFFALVFAGYLAARSGLLALDAVPGLNGFVLYFALPCMLFRFGARLPARELFNPAVLAVYLVAALAVVGVTLALTRSQWAGRAPTSPQLGWADAAFGALVAAFPNSGFMGVPLLVALIGPAAAGPTLSTLLVDLFVTSSLCLAIAHARHGGAPAGAATGDASPVWLTVWLRVWHRVWLRVGRSLRGALTNPQPWAIGLGALSAATGLALPGPAEAAVAMLANAASPVALFTIGAVLRRSGAARRAQAGATCSAAPGGDHLAVALIKLLLHPLLVWGVGTAARALGAELSAFQLMVLVLVAALPSASNVSLLAERHGADTGRVARIILTSTVLAFGSFTLLASGYGVRAAG
ncbi:MAG: AEC family transporter [Leptothrix sp. (in: b-proteobacteria)]